MRESEPFAFQLSFLKETKNPPILDLEEMTETLRALTSADGTFKFRITEDTLAELLNIPEEVECAGPPDGSGCISLEEGWEDLQDVGSYCGECDSWRCDFCVLIDPHIGPKM